MFSLKWLITALRLVLYS